MKRKLTSEIEFGIMVFYMFPKKIKKINENNFVI